MMRAKIKCVARWPGWRQLKKPYRYIPFSYPEPFLRAVRRGALAKSISELASDWLVLIPDIVFLPCFYGIRLWIWPEPLVAPRVRRALGTRMRHNIIYIIAIRKTSIRCTITPRIPSKNTTLANNCRVHIVLCYRTIIIGDVLCSQVWYFLKEYEVL